MSPKNKEKKAFKKLLEELTKAQKLSDEVLNDLLSGSISCTN